MTKWDFLNWIFDRMFSDLLEKVQQIHANQEKLMADTNQIKSDLTDIKANQEETRSDILRVRQDNANSLAKIAELEQQIAALTEKVGQLSELDVIQATVADLKANSRSIADIVEPAPTA